jgi:hypothetical protein
LVFFSRRSIFSHWKMKFNQYDNSGSIFCHKSSFLKVLQSKFVNISDSVLCCIARSRQENFWLFYVSFCTVENYLFVIKFKMLLYFSSFCSVYSHVIQKLLRRVVGCLFYSGSCFLSMMVNLNIKIHILLQTVNILSS